MLWTIASVLVILWLLGFISGYSADYFIHIPLIFAIIVMLVHIEDDCGNHVADRMKKTNPERGSRWGEKKFTTVFDPLK